MGAPRNSFLNLDKFKSFDLIGYKSKKRVVETCQSDLKRSHGYEYFSLLSDHRVMNGE